LEQKRLSVGKLFWELIVRPGSAFQGLTLRTAVWLVIIMAAVGIIFSSIAASVSMSAEIEVSISPEPGEAGEMEDEAIEEILFSSPALSFGIAAGSIFGGLFGFGISWLVKSSLLFGAIGLAGGKMEWTDSVAVVGVSWMPFFFQHLLMGAAYLLNWQLPQFTGVAAALVSHLNIFVLWNLLLLAIGFSSAAAISRAKAFACAAGYQAVVILINVGLAMLTEAFIGSMF